jgi:hypothetical protein
MASEFSKEKAEEINKHLMGPSSIESDREFKIRMDSTLTQS